MRKADRLFQLINLIRNKQPITAECIAEDLEVSVRTVYRYIDDISASGIPIYGTTGIGYQLLEGFELPPLNLTEKELDALLLGVQMVSTWTGNELSKSANSLTTKIEAALPKKVRSEHIKTLYAPDLLNRNKDKQVWENLHQAIKNLNPVFIHYKSLNEEQTSRTIYPLGLFYWGGKWTVGSWCTLRNDFRDFRLDRITHTVVEKSKYPQTDATNLAAYISSFNKS